MKPKQTILSLAMFALFYNNLFAVNYDEFMWAETTIIPASYKKEYWLELYFLPNNSKYGFACSMDGAFAKTSDSGKTWHASTIQKGFHAESVYFADTNIGYVSGAGSIYKTLDGGYTWNRLTLPNIAGSVTTWGHHLTDANNVWFAGGSCSSGRQIIFKSTDGGNTWTSFSTTITNTAFTDLIMFDRNGLGYAVSSGYLWRTLDGGIKWEILNNTPMMNWQTTMPTRNNWHEDIAISNNRSVLIPMSPLCGGNGGGGAQGGLGFSPDLGATWNTFITKGSMFGTFLLNDSTGWGCGYNQEIYWTKDYGKTWKLMNCGISNTTHLDDLWFINDTVGFVCGEGGIYRLVRRDFVLAILGDSVKCKNGFAKLMADKDCLYHEWFEITENGDTVFIGFGKNIIINSEGKYFVRGHIANCGYIQSDTFTVKNFPTQTVEIKTDGKFCIGDTLKIWVEKSDNITNYEWSVNIQNAKINLDTVIIEGVQESKLEILFIYEYWHNCKDTVKYEIDIFDRIKPILAVNGELSFCENDSRIIKLVNANVFSENIWYKDDLEIAKNISEYTVSEAGRYYVFASVNQVCSDTSDVLEIVVRDEIDVLDFSENAIPFFVDSVNYGKQSSRYFKVKNKGEKDFILTHIYFAQKFAFTAPVSQFPLIIPPNETKEILIYYTPTDINEQNDTIYFQDNCTMRKIILSGFGKKNADSAISICDIDIKIATNSVIQKKIFTVGSLAPNPVGTKGKISYTGVTPASYPLFADDNSHNITVQIYDLLGNKIETNFTKEIIALFKTEQYEIEKGELIINTHHLKSGIYFLRINFEDTNYLQMIVR